MKYLPTAILMVMLLTWNVGAQLGVDLVAETFEDDDADIDNANDFNIIPGSNPDEDWYLFDVTDFNSGDDCRMKVQDPFDYTGQLDITSNHLRTQANTPGTSGDCPTQIYTLAFDDEEQVEIVQVDFGWVGSQIAKRNVLEFEGVGQLIGALCQFGVDIFLTTSADASCGTPTMTENFEDDSAIGNSDSGTVTNVVPGSNPDEDWYFFNVILFNPGGSGCKMFVGNEEVNQGMTVPTQHLTTGVFTTNACPDARYGLEFDVEQQVSAVEFSHGWTRDQASGTQAHWVEFRGEAQTIAGLCIRVDEIYVTNVFDDNCGISNRLVLEPSTSDTECIIDYRFEFDWNANTVTGSIVGQNAHCTGVVASASQTIGFANPAVDTMQSIRVRTTNLGASGQGLVEGFLDNVVVERILSSTQDLLEETSDISCLVNYQFFFDWTNETINAEVIGFSDECNDITVGSNATIPFANSVTSMNGIKVTTNAVGDDDQVVTVLDDVIIQGLITVPEEVVDPVDLEEGITLFANEYGFKTQASLKLFAIIAIAISMIITASITHFFSDSKYKNWVILGVGVVVSSFFILIEFLFLWESTIAIVLGGASVQGIRESLANIRLPGPVRIPRQENTEPITEVENVDVSIGQRIEAVEEQIRQERREREES